MIIAENFIQDIASNVSNKSPKVAFQFKKIISELKKMASRAQNLDPKYKEMINTLSVTADENFETVKSDKTIFPDGVPDDYDDCDEAIPVCEDVAICSGASICDAE